MKKIFGNRDSQAKVEAVATLLFVVFAMGWLLRYGYVWRWVESLSLFVPGETYFRTFLNNPGGVLAYVGSFLTQFLYVPIVGCAILVALLCLVQWATKCLFRLSGYWALCVYLPAFLLLAAVLNVGYTWATLKAPGHFFVPTLGTLAALGGLVAFRRVPDFLGRLVVMLALVALYPFLGFYALFAAGLCLIEECVRRPGRLCGVLLVVGVAAIYLFPKLYYYGLDATEQELSRLYVAGLPTFYIRRAELMLWLPFLLLVFVFLAISLLPGERVNGGRPLAIGAWGTFGMGLLFMLWQTYDDPDFEASVRSSLAIEDEDWPTAAQALEGRRGKATTRIVAINDQLAAAYLDKPLPQTALPAIPPSYKDSRPGLLTFMQLSGLGMNYYSGQMNLAYRWAMELSVEYGFRVSYLKWLVKCALFNGELALAQKYNDQLKRTLFHRDWAVRYQRYIDRPELIEKDATFSRIPRDPLPNRFVE